MQRCVLVGDDATFRVVEFRAGGDTLTVLQTLVDGYIEHAAARVGSDQFAPVDVWVNEEGRLREDFRTNDQIGAVLGHRAPELVGPAVVALTDSDGDTVGLPDDLLAETCRRVAAAGAEQLPDADSDIAAGQQRTVRSRRS